jgi:hypothetical protein
MFLEQMALESSPRHPQIQPRFQGQESPTIPVRFNVAEDRGEDRGFGSLEPPADLTVKPLTTWEEA